MIFSGRTPTQTSSTPAGSRPAGTRTVPLGSATVAASGCRCRTVARIRLDWPRKFAANVVAGFS